MQGANIIFNKTSAMLDHSHFSLNHSDMSQNLQLHIILKILDSRYDYFPRPQGRLTGFDGLCFPVEDEEVV